jgi:hypothetical protein
VVVAIQEKSDLCPRRLQGHSEIACAVSCSCCFPRSRKSSLSQNLKEDISTEAEDGWFRMIDADDRWGYRAVLATDEHKVGCLAAQYLLP